MYFRAHEAPFQVLFHITDLSDLPVFKLFACSNGKHDSDWEGLGF